MPLCFLFDGTPEQQRTLWTTGIEAMAKVHNADWRALGFDFLDKPERGKTGLDQQLAYYLEYYDWARQGSPQPTAQAALDWILANRPDDDGRPIGLVWGDSRIGNILFGPDGLRLVLDWEIAHAGDPIEDMGFLCIRSWRFGGDKPIGGGCHRLLANSRGRCVERYTRRERFAPHRAGQRSDLGNGLKTVALH